MKKVNNFSFDRDYNVKANIAIVIKKIILTQFSLAIIAFFTNFIAFSGGRLVVTTLNTFYIGSLILAVNLITFLYLFISWHHMYYIISSNGISSSKGIISKKTNSIDTPAIRSIKVQQSILGKIFNYGTIILESPLLSEKFLMRDLPNPHRHASLIEKARMKSINKIGAENVIISQ